MRKRQLPRSSKGGGRGFRGAYPSIKSGRMVNYLSLIERDICYWIDFDPATLAFESQPLQIKYAYAGKSRIYTPDYRVSYQDRPPEIVEGKPAKKISDPDNQMKFAAAREWCAANQHTFRVITDEDLRTGHRLRNIKFLTQYAWYQVQPAQKYRVMAALQRAASDVSVIELADWLDSTKRNEWAMVVFHMAYFHEVQIAVDEVSISVHSIVGLPELSAG